MNARRFSLSVALYVASLSACNPDDENIFKVRGNAETKPKATLLSTLDGRPNQGAGREAASEAAAITYLVRVKTNSGIDFCDGVASLRIMSDFNILVPEAKVTCGSIVIDLGAVLGGAQGITGGANTNGALAGDKSKSLAHDGMIFYTKELMGATFSGDGRPILLGPIVQNAAPYKDFKKSIRTTVSGTDPATQRPVIGAATFNLEVIDHQTTYKNKYIDKPFENILHWKIEAIAEDKLPSSLGLLFEKWEFLWNTNPIMVPQMQIVANLKNFIDDPNNTSDLVGKITLTMLVKEYSIAD